VSSILETAGAACKQTTLSIMRPTPFGFLSKCYDYANNSFKSEDGA